MVGTPGNKAAKKARAGQIAANQAAGLRPGKIDAVAFEVADYNSEDMKRPGAFMFFKTHGDPEGTRRGIIHACPCGCGNVGSLYFKGNNPGRAEWNVTGEWPKASLTPSIGFYASNTREQGFHWHGYLTEGVFREC